MTSHNVCVNWVQNLYSTSNPCSVTFFCCCAVYFFFYKFVSFDFCGLYFLKKNHLFENKGFLFSLLFFLI